VEYKFWALTDKFPSTEVLVLTLTIIILLLVLKKNLLKYSTIHLLFGWNAYIIDHQSLFYIYIVALVPVLATHIFIFSCTGSPIPLLLYYEVCRDGPYGLGYSVLFVNTWYRCCITILNKRYLAQGAETAGLALGQWTRAG
jgi:hypothetical protein